MGKYIEYLPTTNRLRLNCLTSSDHIANLIKDFFIKESGTRQINDYRQNKLLVMKNKIAQTIIAGLIATIVMTAVGLMAPYMGLPKMNPAEMLTGIVGTPVLVGYLMHCMIGIIFAAAYVYIFNPKVHINSKLLKGLVFGLAVFVFAQVMMLIIGAMMPMPAMGDKMLMMIGSLIGHLVYGIVVVLIVPNYSVSRSKNGPQTVHAY